AGESALAVALVLTSLVAYYYYLRLVWKMYFEAAPEDRPLPTVPRPGFRWAVTAGAAALVLVGLFPSAAIEWAQDAVAVAGEPSAAGASAPSGSPETVGLQTTRPSTEAPRPRPTQ
ncbi:MAG: hypothetical protein MJB57_15025, partial [Gemmatimonadetes bacterium]|nr:hypothetical protein [Gemmatimonadota bacterium]